MWIWIVGGRLLLWGGCGSWVGWCLGLGFRYGGYVVVVVGCMLVVLFVFGLLLHWFGFGLFGRLGFLVILFCVFVVGWCFAG